MKVRVKIDFTQFESISQSSGERLIGGFSTSFSIGAAGFEGDVEGNNCEGGNCVDGCGNGQNNKCNTVAGCGSPLPIG